MSQGLAFLIWLLCVGISAILIAYFLKHSSSNSLDNEGFVVKMCPGGTNSFVTDSGETQCCNGDIVDGYCTGNLRCTLSPKSRSGLPTCADLAVSDAASAGANKCPTSMPNYFGSCNTIEGCSASPPSANGLQPSDPLQPQCILYKTHAEDLVKLDSCYNVTQANLKADKCAAAEATAKLPACTAAAAAAKAPAAAGPNCPAPPPPQTCPTPPDSKFVMHGIYMGGARVPIQRKHVMSDTNIVHAVQQGEHTKMVITDKNNSPITSRYYVGSINEIPSRVPNTATANTLGDAQGGYNLALNN